MNIREKIILQIQNMPDELVEQVNDFMDYLLIKHSDNNWELWLEFKESVDMDEYDFYDCLSHEVEDMKQQQMLKQQSERDDFWAQRDAERKQKDNQ